MNRSVAITPAMISPSALPQCNLETRGRARQGSAGAARLRFPGSERPGGDAYEPRPAQRVHVASELPKGRRGADLAAGQHDEAAVPGTSQTIDSADEGRSGVVDECPGSARSHIVRLAIGEKTTRAGGIVASPGAEKMLALDPDAVDMTDDPAAPGMYTPRTENVPRPASALRDPAPDAALRLIQNSVPSRLLYLLFWITPAVGRARLGAA